MRATLGALSEPGLRIVMPAESFLPIPREPSRPGCSFEGSPSLWAERKTMGILQSREGVSNGWERIVGDPILRISLGDGIDCAVNEKSNL